MACWDDLSTPLLLSTTDARLNFRLAGSTESTVPPVEPDHLAEEVEKESQEETQEENLRGIPRINELGAQKHQRS